MLALAFGFTLAFLFLVPVVSSAPRSGVYVTNCPANGCLPRFESVTYWGLGVGGIGTYFGSYSISAVASATANSASSSVSHTVSSACIGPTTTSTMLNGTSTLVKTCSVTQLILDAQGCYNYSSGATLCVRGAPLDAVADLYGNGTIIVTYPSGFKVSCDPGTGTGPCIVGIP